MKRVCFIEFDGILSSNKTYTLNLKRAKEFMKNLSEYCKKNSIELILVSGFHEKIAKQKLAKSFVKKYFDAQHFFYVDEKYLISKNDADEKMHRENLERDKEFNDSYFKQVLIQQFLHDNKIDPREVLLLCNDIWVDAYYTTRFSKVDFALFEENLCDRGKRTELISGLAYFNLDFSSVKLLLEKFPLQNLCALDKYVFETMKKALLNDVDLNALKKKAIERGQDNVVK